MKTLRTILITTLMLIAILADAETIPIIYFTPSDVAPPTDERIRKIEVTIREVWSFYGHEMIRHGYRATNYPFEMDWQRVEPIVKTFQGEHTLQRYIDKLGMIDDELPMALRARMENPHNIRIIFIAGAGNIRRAGKTHYLCVMDTCYFTAYIPAEHPAMNVIVAKELGYCFELPTNENVNEEGKTFLMKGSVPVRDNPPLNLNASYQLDAHDAHWLSARKRFGGGVRSFHGFAVNKLENVAVPVKVVNSYARPDDPGYLKMYVKIEGGLLWQARITRITDGALIAWDKLRLSKKVFVGGLEHFQYTKDDTAIFRVPVNRLDTAEVSLYIITLSNRVYRQHLTINIEAMPVTRKNGDNTEIAKMWCELKSQN